MATHSSILAWEITSILAWDMAWEARQTTVQKVIESDTTETPHKPGSGLPFITPGGGERRLAGTQGGTRALVSSRSGRTSQHVELP